MVSRDGMVPIHGAKPGDRVEITVRRLSDTEKPDRRKLYGWMRGKIHIREDFDDPIPGMEDYM